MYRKVNSSLWRQPWFVNLDPEARLVYLYLLTGAEIQPNGIGFLDAKRIAFDLHLMTGNVSFILQADLKDRVLIFPEHGLLWLRGFSESQGAGPKWEAAINNANHDIPQEVLDTIADALSQTPDTVSVLYPPGTGEGTGEGEGTEEEVAATSPPPARAKKVKEVFDPFEETFLQELHLEFADLWSPNRTNELIGKAMNHVASKKAISLKRYVQDWLRRDAQEIRGKNGSSPSKMTGPELMEHQKELARKREIAEAEARRD
jgi:hypothetical protein